ncbi:MAG: NAD(P)-dependent oxidoreductase [Hyphomicrobiales bacterium]|nr:NAD(P)-dependent oxidoreductase [Hyphomicrobiales bacterium]
MTGSALHIAITGANGFIGRYTVAAALSRGHRVIAIIRNRRRADPAWLDHPQIEIIEIDLSEDDNEKDLAVALRGVDAVIHTVAAMSGDESVHDRNTLKPTRAVLDTVTDSDFLPRFVLVSSLAVYDVGAVEQGQPLDETTALVSDVSSRDDYCRSKLVQEGLALAAAEASGFELIIMRPGVVFGPGRLWNGHIGQALGPLVVQLEKNGQVPVSFVENCAEALVLAAEAPVEHGVRDGRPTVRRAEFINVLDDDLPDRGRYVAALRQSGWPRYVLPGSWRPLAVAGSAVRSLAPRLSGRMPGLLRPDIIRSRLKPISYSNARLHERLGWSSSRTFEDAMQRSVAETAEDGHARAG